MMRTLTLCAAIGAFWTINAADSSAATVNIVRGDQAEKISTVRKSRLPQILRGIPASVERHEKAPKTEMSRLQPIGVGGGTLWLRDTQTGHVVACTVRSTGIVGRDRFRCFGGNP